MRVEAAAYEVISVDRDRQAGLGPLGIQPTEVVADYQKR
jgi:hypothetical protein